MNIKGIHTNHMRNDEHFQFNFEFSGLVNRIGAVALKIKPQFDVYTPLYQDEDTALKKIMKSAITAEIHEADKQRDIIFSGMVDTLNAALKHFNVQKQNAAKRLKIVFDTYGNLAKKPLNEQTSGIINMLQDLNGAYKTDSQTAGIAEWAAELASRNDTVSDLMRDRYDETAARTDIVLKEARMKVDEAYRVIVERINALVIVDGLADYEEFIRTLNAIIEKYNNIMAQRHGKGKKKGEEEEIEN